MGQVWYLIVSIPDLCTLTYLEKKQDIHVSKFYIAEIHDRLKYHIQLMHITFSKFIIYNAQ